MTGASFLLALSLSQPATASDPWEGRQLAPAEARAWQASRAPSEASADGIAATSPISFDPDAAVDPGTLDKGTLRFLKPRRSRMPQNPFGSTTFTAYTLEWGEMRMGLGGIAVGVLPRSQLGTSPVLDALGIYNATAKFNFARTGPLDLALEGSWFQLPMGAFRAYQGGGALTASIRLLPAWSLHLTGGYNVLGADGIPDITQLPPLVRTLSGDPDLSGTQATIDTYTDGVEVHARARAATARVATDVRLNRRDSIVLQGSAMVWGHAETDLSNVPPILGLDQALEAEGFEAMQSTWVATAAWQFQWKHAELRVGGGWSGVPGAWLLQSTEFAWRFGGKTKREERIVRKGWKRNRRLVKRADRDGNTPDAT